VWADWSAAWIRRGITWTSFTEVAMNTGSAVAWTEWDARNRKCSEADCG
jgi:hypothetical protein